MSNCYAEEESKHIDFVTHSKIPDPPIAFHHPQNKCKM